MAKKKSLEQHIAVFGESGSGKTVLLSSFFGSMQQPGRNGERQFNLVADNPAQGTQLLQKYFAMKKEAKLPPSNRHKADSYQFSVHLKTPLGTASGKATPSHTVRLVWHDYPGEWFDQEVSGETEEQRRLALFRSLLVSDVALLLVDGQELIDHTGEEERYLGKLFGSLSNTLLALKDDLLEDEKQLVLFPRIWVLGLSKADLLPEMTVDGLSELVTRTAGHHLNHLREVIQVLIAGDEALSVGEDLMLLSSAKFEPGQIDVDERIGVDLILPLAAMLPFERHLRWAGMQEIPVRVARELLHNSVGTLKVLGAASIFLKKLKLPGPIAVAATGLATLLSSGVVNDISGLADKKLEVEHAKAVKKKEYLAATLLQFKLDLEQAERDGVLKLSQR